MTTQEANALVQRAVDMLGEHFESVQVLANWQEAGIHNVTRGGTGSVQARVGMCQEVVDVRKCELGFVVLQAMRDNEQKG